MGGRGGFSGIGGGDGNVNTSNRFSDFEKSLTSRFKRYDYGGKTIFKIGNGYGVYDFKDNRITDETKTLVMIKNTLRDAKQAIDLGNKSHKR